LAQQLFGEFINTTIWAFVIILISVLILANGKYKLLDNLMKVIVITLTVSTIIAVVLSAFNYSGTINFAQILPENTAEIAFLIAFMGWMPAPLDISVWHSLWAIEKKKSSEEFSPKSALFDFNVGYVSTIILGIAFVTLGALVMFQSGESFSSSAGTFANQLLEMYTKSLGSWAYLFIGIAAFTTMFSTTLTTLDASPRAMEKTTQLLTGSPFKTGYLFWILILTVGTIIIFFFFASEMGLLIKIATILSFLTAPFYAITNYVLISSKHTPQEWRPSTSLHLLSILGILFLIGFSIWYLVY
jgi:Mn2+/Fe2+ NRAMP family transporter